MKTPLEEFLAMKTAGFGRTFGNAATGAGATALVGAGAAALTVGASKAYDAITKRRDFATMLDHNPDLAEHHAADPRTFNRLYSSLRTVNPTFAKDPIIAGTYMRRMVESPMAGGVLTDALAMNEKVPQHVGEAFRRGAGDGAKGFLRGE
jgi:hypothetical protein